MKKLFFLILLFATSTNCQSELFEKIKSMSNSVSIENLSHHIKTLERSGGFYSRVALTPGDDSGVVYIENELKKLPNISVELDTFFLDAPPPLNSKPQFNVVATIEGKNSNGYYLIGGHHDCSASRMGSEIWNSQWETIKAPGADDNATGIALLLELARIITDPVFNYQPDYSIKLVAFGAEEYGPAYTDHHAGSAHFANNAKSIGDNILAMIAIDMIGFNNRYDYLDIVSNQNSKSIGEKFINTNELFNIGLTIKKPPFVEAAYSDHSSFWDAGYKAILLIENAPPWKLSLNYISNPFYHTSSDTFETLNMNLIKKVSQVTLASITSYASRLIVGIDEQTNMVHSFKLFQNYPNPFNPSTIISWQSPVSSRQTLKIYDLLGNEVSTLVDEYRRAGNYEVEFDAAGLASGVYFYKLQAGNYAAVKKAIILR